MKKGIVRQAAFAAIAATVISCCTAHSAFATTVSVDLTSPGSSLAGTNVLYGVYVGAYTRWATSRLPLGPFQQQRHCGPESNRTSLT